LESWDQLDAVSSIRIPPPKGHREKGTQRLDALDQFGEGGLASEIFRFPLEPLKEFKAMAQSLSVPTITHEQVIRP